MNSSMMRGVRRSLGLLATGIVMAGGFSGAAAQAPAGAVVQPMDGGARLRDQLTSVGNNPQSIDALISAGRAALEMGDVDAALTFFGRADELSPRNGRVKAGIGAALVHLGQPQAAMSLFAEAASLGAAEVEFGADRGLAYDLMGDPRRAQQDYVAVLRRREDLELRRRLALSLAISGQRDAALRMIDPQLRRNERAAWRAQAFILALTGDTAGANRTAQAMLPGGAQAMAPYFARLAALSPSQKAMAVHLGRFPNGGGGRATAAHDVTADPSAIALAMGGAAPATPPRTTNAALQSSSARRRPEPPRERQRRESRQSMDSGDRYGLRADTRIVRQPQAAAARPNTQPAARPAQPPPARQAEQPAQVAELNPRWSGSPYPSQPQASAPPSITPVQPPSPATGWVASPPSTTAQQGSAIVATDIPASTPAQQPPASFVLPPATTTPTTAAEPPASAPTTVETSGRTSLADIAAVVEALPQEQQARSTPPRAAPRPAPQRTVLAPPQPANPSRHWVQIAGGIERTSASREFARLRSMAPDQLGRRAAFTAPMQNSSRLLVGPFASAREAQAFVNQLAGHNVAAFAWTSAAGQEIERLAAR